MIVEDNKQSYELLQMMLQKYGLCDIVENGEDAFEQFKNAITEDDPYDVIFLDILMPGIDGNEVLRRIRAWEKEKGITEKKVQVVMASSKADTDTILTSYDDGCQHFFMKPYDMTELEDLMQKMGFAEQA